MTRRAGRVALLAVAALLAACTTSPSPTPSPPTVPPATSSAPGPSEWQAIDLPSNDPERRYTTVVATPGGFVAAGQGVRTRAWSSVDGEHWTEEPIAGDTRWPTSATSWGEAVLLLGVGEFGPGCGHPVAIGTWLRAADATWTQAPFDSKFCVGGDPSAAVAGDLAVIVGAGSGDVPYAFASNDGLAWRDAGAVFPEGLPHGVVATAAGFVAVGTGDAGAWYELSRDGLAWTDPARLPGPGQARPLGAAALGDRFVVLLAALDGSVGVASSSDGRTWAAEPAAGLRADSVARVEAIPGGLVAIGGDESGALVWVSTDGRSWRALGLPDFGGATGFVPDIAVGHDRAVLVGFIGRADGSTAPAAWLGPASLLAP